MMLSKRLFALFLAIMIICTTGLALAAPNKNLLENGGFEKLDESGMPVGWHTEAYVRQEGYTTYGVSSESFSGDHCAVINNIGMNDARFVQTVEVVPASLYCLSGWIKVDSMLDSGRGANLSIEDLYVFSESIYEADDQWHYVEMYGQTGEDQYEVTIFARVGGYSGESQGKAYFDQLALREVDAVPYGHEAEMWIREERAVTVAPIEDDEAEAQPFWPWLLVISAGYVALAVWMSTYVMLDRRELQESRHPSILFWAGFTLAAAARIAVALVVEGYQVDVNCFRSWGHTMASVGPALFYESTSFCDYTPAYIYIMSLSDVLAKAGSSMGLNIMEAFYHKLVPMLCDMAGAYLLYDLARRERFSRRQAELMGLFMAFNPAMFINSAAWCQIDSVLCLGLVLVAWLAVQRKWAVLLPVYVVCALIKPQALMLGPLGLVVIVLHWIRHREDTRSLLLGLLYSAIAAALIVIPFGLRQEFGWLIEKYASTLASYPYATVNTANFYYLFNANWAGIAENAHWLAALCMSAMCLGWGIVLFLRMKSRHYGWVEPAIMGVFALIFMMMAILGTTWSVFGSVAMVMAFAVVLPMYIRSGNVRHVPLLGAVLFVLLYVLGIKMHERYLFPALLLLGLAFILHRDRRILGLLAVLSCIMLINEGIVLDNSIRLGSSMGHLNNDTRVLSMIVSLINVACVGWSVWTAHRICVENIEQKLDDKPHLPIPVRRYEEHPCTVESYKTDPSLHWKPIDWVLMLLITAIYSVVCLINLGSTKAPQHPWTSTAYDEAVVIDLGEIHEDFSMLYFAQVSYNNFSVAVSEDGQNWSWEYWAQMNQGECFRWKYLAPSYDKGDGTIGFNSVSTYDDVQKLTGRYVRVTAQQINLVLNEVIFRDKNGEQIAGTVVDQLHANSESPNLSEGSYLLDEQDTLVGEPGWFTGTYFDEIYHARTAYEHLHGTSPYETSHPPLGKVIMSWFVGIFGMTPFGWRFAGALAGILMLPAMYVLGKQLTKRTDMAFAAMMLMALDCMHLTQTRIATIDSFPVLFIILSYLFMLRFMQREIVLEPIQKLLPDLALSGFFMGCSVASKWIGAYAGIGLAVLFFWTCGRHLLLSCKAAHACHGVDHPDKTLVAQDQHAWKRIVYLCLWCLLFFVAVPLLVYLLSYVPYFAYAHKENLWDFLEMVWQANFREKYGMLAYHSQPGLGMDHPFYSPWYEWPLIKRPMYYAMASFTPEGYSYSIFCFGNPAVWLFGLVGLAATLFVWCRRHVYALKDSDQMVHIHADNRSIAPAFVLIGFLAQFLPWVLVPRGTYIYHYFASIPFLILSTVLLMHWLTKRWPREGRIVLMAYLILCLVCFIAFYPYASGVLAPEWWLDFMKQFLKVYYA